MPKEFFSNHNSAISRHGFTLLELLVVISIMVIIFSVGFANFRGFQERQKLIIARDLLKTDLRFAQQQALSGIKPPGCTILNGYKLEKTTASLFSYDITASCVDPNMDIDVKNLNYADRFPQIELSKFSFVYFNILGRGVRSNLIITLTDRTPEPDQSITVTVTEGGQVN